MEGGRLRRRAARGSWVAGKWLSSSSEEAEENSSVLEMVEGVLPGGEFEDSAADGAEFAADFENPEAVEVEDFGFHGEVCVSGQPKYGTTADARKGVCIL